MTYSYIKITVTMDLIFTYMSPQIGQFDIAGIVVKCIDLCLHVDLLFPPVAVNSQEQIDNDLLQEVDYAELEHVAAGLAEDTTHGNLLDASIVSHIVPELVNVLDNLEVRHENANLRLDVCL